MTPPSRASTLQTIGEFGLIRELQKHCHELHGDLIQGIGDDTAILPSPNKDFLLASTDLAIEGIHFDLGLASYKDVGYRTAVANISDIVAMGGSPKFLLAAVAVPPSCPVKNMRALYQGMKEPCRTYNISLVGGDTSSSRSGLFLCLTILGHVKPNRAITRQGAKQGDLVYVTGTLGDSHAGLQILQHHMKSRKRSGRRLYETFLKNRHLRPTPRVALGQHLSQNRLANAAIDLSDGLSGDIHHLCQASQVGVELWASRLPLSQPCQAFAAERHLDPIDLALAGGEDYELLFTVKPSKRDHLLNVSKSFKTKVTCIGEIKPKSYGLRLKLEGQRSRNISRQSYNHFSHTRTTI